MRYFDYKNDIINILYLRTSLKTFFMEQHPDWSVGQYDYTCAYCCLAFVSIGKCLWPAEWVRKIVFLHENQCFGSKNSVFSFLPIRLAISIKTLCIQKGL